MLTKIIVDLYYGSIRIGTIYTQLEISKQYLRKHNNKLMITHIILI